MLKLVLEEWGLNKNISSTTKHSLFFNHPNPQYNKDNKEIRILYSFLNKKHQT